MTPTEIAREMHAALIGIGWTCDEIVETEGAASFVASKPATSDRRGNRVPPQKQRRTIDANGHLIVARLDGGSL